MNIRVVAFLAALGATTIYGINHTVAKGVMPDYVGAFGFIFLRTGGAALLFWISSIFVKSEKIAKQDWKPLITAAILGASINMLSFFKGLELSTPINSSILVTITPIIVVIFSSILLKEKIYFTKVLGIAMGLVGAIGLVIYGKEVRMDAPNIPLGNTLFIVNATAYGLYLIVIKKVMEKYQPITVLKWVFTIAFIVNLPITYSSFNQINWEMPPSIIASVVFVILGTTYMTYLFNGFALTKLKASTVSSFVYVQPLIGIIVAILSGQDQLNFTKVAAGILVLSGVYFASKKQTI
ncbi:MAG: DMT family transporter [Flavobacteriaceae bacterium]|nr:DMT family transporter [Flavobacteriaceae bacterium]NVJ72483.1 DMT family transporter [Flavobacteriaceae bacterium]